VVATIQCLQIRNYKSIAQAVVDLEPLTVFVGPNGGGKSNLIDAVKFVADSLSESIELAFKNRGGIGAVRRRSGGHPTHIGIRLELSLSKDVQAAYAFEIAAERHERFRVAYEFCKVRRFFREEHVFELRNGKFIKEIPGIRPQVASDRLGLFAASATEEFRPVYDFLTSMRFYSIMPHKLRELQEPDPGEFLKRDGSNAAAVLKRVTEVGEGNDRYKRLCRLLADVVPGVEKVEYQAIGQKETLRFKQDVGLSNPCTFDSHNMSDGTLRVLGLLLAVYQPGHSSLVTIEEPEATIHPATAELVVQVLTDASQERQVFFTTYSPDILDNKGLSETQIRVVTMEHGRTIVAEPTESGKEAIRERLYTPGELLRLDELNPDVRAAEEAASQLDLFRSSFSTEPGEE